MIDALFLSRITFSFFEATSVHCASDAATMVAYVGCCVGSGTGNHFLEHWRTKLQRLAKYAARHVKHRISNVCVGVSYQSCYHWMLRACRQTIEGDAQVCVAVKTQGVSPQVYGVPFLPTTAVPAPSRTFWDFTIDKWSSCRPALHARPLVYRSSHP